MPTFTHDMLPGRVVSGPGTLGDLGNEIARLGRTRPAIVCTPGSSTRLKRDVSLVIPDGAAIWLASAAMHTPVDVTSAALAALLDGGADCLVAVGGGSAIGLSKALALRTGLPQIAVPTTYAGSEMTPVVGETEAGVKVTRRDMKLLPRTVVYDPVLTIGLPFATSLTSAVNGMAHAVEALYAKDRSPLVADLARRGIRSFLAALPGIHADPADLEARGLAQLAAMACGKCLGEAGMSLHHKLCHTLGGAFALPHAETHTVLLPHVMAFNAPLGTRLGKEMAEAFGMDDPAGELWDLIRSMGGPVSLKSLGFEHTQIAHAVELALANSYDNPRQFGPADIQDILNKAAGGLRPTSH